MQARKDKYSYEEELADMVSSDTAPLLDAKQPSFKEDKNTKDDSVSISPDDIERYFSGGFALRIHGITPLFLMRFWPLENQLSAEQDNNHGFTI